MSKLNINIMEKYGIENLKKLVRFIFLGLNTTLDMDKNNDGKLSFSELLSAVTTLSFKFPSLYNAFPFLRKEYKDLSDQELEELRAFISQMDLSADHKDLEDMIRLTVNALHYNYRYVKKMKVLLNA